MEHAKSPAEAPEKKEFFLMRWWGKIKSIFKSTRSKVEKVLDEKPADYKTLQEAVDSQKITVVEGDITKQKVDGMVNAANIELKHGGGVDDAIRTAGGPAITDQYEKIKKPLEIGDVVVVDGGKLNAKILTAGVMSWGKHTDGPAVKLCVKNIIREAKALGLKKIAIPALGAGAGGLGPEISARVIRDGLAECAEDLAAFEEIKIVIHPEPNSVAKAGHNVPLWVFESTFKTGKKHDESLPKAA